MNEMTAKIIAVICAIIFIFAWIGAKYLLGLSDRAIAVIVLSIPVVICLWEAYKACNNGKL